GAGASSGSSAGMGSMRRPPLDGRRLSGACSAPGSSPSTSAKASGSGSDRAEGALLDIVQDDHLPLLVGEDRQRLLGEVGRDRALLREKPCVPAARSNPGSTGSGRVGEMSEEEKERRRKMC